MTLSALAARHCTKHRPALTLDGFARTFYGISGSELRRVANNECRATDPLLLRFHAAQSRFFPGESVTVALRDGRRATLGPAGLAITFPSNP